VRDYDLAATLTSGQVFRWQPVGDSWEGVVGSNWVRMQPTPGGLRATTAVAQADWSWLRHFLQTEADLGAVLATFPEDEPMRRAVAAWRGLRLLRQDPWECLASFILSSTKQIVQIRQIVATLCRRFGAPISVPQGKAAAFAFPTAHRLARAGESELRDCKMGFRAPYLRAVSKEVADGRLNLEALRAMPLAEARQRLTALPGVGKKIADCVLLFACGQRTAFPLDVWVIRALRQLYFRGRAVPLARLQDFAANHFGPNSGYAQQYLFHYLRTKLPQRETIGQRGRAQPARVPRARKPKKFRRLIAASQPFP